MIACGPRAYRKIMKVGACPSDRKRCDRNHVSKYFHGQLWWAGYCSWYSKLGFSLQLHSPWYAAGLCWTVAASTAKHCFTTLQCHKAEREREFKTFLDRWLAMICRALNQVRSISSVPFQIVQTFSNMFKPLCHIMSYHIISFCILEVFRQFVNCCTLSTASATMISSGWRAGWRACGRSKLQSAPGDLKVS